MYIYIYIYIYIKNTWFIIETFYALFIIYVDNIFEI